MLRLTSSAQGGSANRTPSSSYVAPASSLRACRNWRQRRLSLDKDAVLSAGHAKQGSPDPLQAVALDACRFLEPPHTFFATRITLTPFPGRRSAGRPAAAPATCYRAPARRRRRQW